MQRYGIIFLFVIILITSFGCKDRKKINIKLKETEKVKLDLKIIRFDRMMATLNTENFESKLKEIESKAPEMYKLYIEQVTRAGLVNDQMYIKRLKPFVLDEYSQELYSDVWKKFPDLKKTENQLSEVFSYINHYFPKDTIPKFYSMVSNFFHEANCSDNMIIVSLDLFLGADYKYYLDTRLFPNYKRVCQREEYMLPLMIKAYFELRFPEKENSSGDLLSQMIYQGKMLYYLDLMMPGLEDSIKIEYSQKQLDWADKYEGLIWNQLIKNNVLYSTEEMKTSRYLGEAPFTNAPGMPQETPPRIGAWVGWQIVKKYVEKNKNVSLIKVFSEKNAQIILSVSGYKPKIR